jgi:HD-GYP domain-containing protein (c-di-GMP phosphodiesterase class II)
MTFEDAVGRLRLLAGKKFDPASVSAFERAFQAGDVSPAKARQASVASRHFDINALIGDAPPPARLAATRQAPSPSV